jgi:hypothetical protein
LWSHGVCMLILFVACVVYACKLSIFWIDERQCVMRHKIPQVKPNMEKCPRRWTFFTSIFYGFRFFSKHVRFCDVHAFACGILLQRKCNAHKIAIKLRRFFCIQFACVWLWIMQW